MRFNRYTRRDFLRRTGLSGAALAAYGSKASGSDNSTRRPNVLFIICDDLNDSIAGMGGHPQARTPNIDRLTGRSVQFSNAHTNCPLCGPSRASVWSGLYPHTTGYYGYKQQANKWRRNAVLANTVTVMEHFTANGYDVFATGKIHHNGHEDWSIFRQADGSDGFGVKPSFGPFPWDGISVNANGRKTWMNHPDMPDALQEGIWEDSFGPLSDIPEYKPDSARGIPGYRGWVLYNQPYRYVSDDDRDPMPDERSAAWAAARLSEPRNHPFFLAVGFNRPHTPLYAPKKYFDLFPLDQIQLPPHLENDLDDCAKILWRNPRTGRPSGYGFHRFDMVMRAEGVRMWKRWIQAYLACVAFVDDQVGTLLKALEQGPYAENTIVVLTGDHGYHMGEKDYLFKNSVWEESTRVPLILHAPGVTQSGTVCAHPVSLIDMYPTLIDLCGLPSDPNARGNRQSLDGHSVRAFLSDPENGIWKGPPVALSVIAGNDKLAVDEPGKVERQHFTVRSRRWRYTRCNNGEEELYDHKADVHEWRNLAGDPRYSEIVKKLRGELAVLTGLVQL